MANISDKEQKLLDFVFRKAVEIAVFMKENDYKRDDFRMIGMDLDLAEKSSGNKGDYIYVKLSQYYDSGNTRRIVSKCRVLNNVSYRESLYSDTEETE